MNAFYGDVLHTYTTGVSLAAKKGRDRRLLFRHTLSSGSWDDQHIHHETDRQYRQKTLLSDDQPSGERQYDSWSAPAVSDGAIQQTISNLKISDYFKFEHEGRDCCVVTSRLSLFLREKPVRHLELTNRAR